MVQNSIYLISFEYLPFSDGGLARHAKSMIDRLAKRPRFKAVIAVSSKRKYKSHNNIVFIPCTFFDNKYLCYLEFSLKFFLKYRYLFNTHTFVFFSLYSYFLIPFLPKKFFLFVHSNAKRLYITNYLEERGVARYIRKAVYYVNFRWESYLCNKAVKVISVSPSLKDETISQYNIHPNRIAVINNGLDTNIFKKNNASKIPIKSLLYVGKLSYRKNILDLINIFQKLTDTDPEFKLHMVGNGEQEYMDKVIAKINKYKLTDKVFIYPYSTDTALNDLYTKCGIFVLTSLVEGFGLVVLEAMAKGMPVVAYNNLGVRDIINGSNGYIIDPFDHKHFVNKILHLYEHTSVYQKMSKNAVKTIDNYSWDRSVSKLVRELR